MSELSLANAYYKMSETPSALAERWTEAARKGQVVSTRTASSRIAEAYKKDMRKGSIEAIGAISIYSYYEGIARRCLVEDMYEAGTQRAYTILDKQVPALMMTPGATTTPQMYVGLNKIYPQLGTIRAEVQLPLIDMVTLPQDPLPYLQRQAVWGITKQEDTAFLAALEGALNIYQTMSGTSANVYTTSGTVFTKDMFAEGKSFLMANQQQPDKIVMNPGDYADIMNMPIQQMGVIKEDEINGQFKLKSWMGLDIITSVVVPQGTCYILPARENLGVMPTVGGICAMDNPMYASQLVASTIYAEFIGMIVENPYIVKLTKTVSNPYPNLVNPQPLGAIA